MTVLDEIGTCNAYVVLSDAQAEQLLHDVLTDLQPGLLGIQEWDGPKPDLATLNVRGRAVDELLERTLQNTRYRFARPAGGGNPVVWDASRYHLVSIKRRTLVGQEFVGHLAGRKSKLPASTVTVAVFEDQILGGHVTLIVMHLTAEVQAAGRYYTDLKHALRVRRHKRERAGVARIAAAQRGRAYVTGDTNFDDMNLPGLVPCWAGHARQEATGTLGHRTVDYVYAADRATRVQIKSTRSDHDTVVATYRRQENP